MRDVESINQTSHPPCVLSLLIYPPINPSLFNDLIIIMNGTCGDCDCGIIIMADDILPSSSSYTYLSSINHTGITSSYPGRLK